MFTRESTAPGPDWLMTYTRSTCHFVQQWYVTEASLRVLFKEVRYKYQSPLFI